MQIPTATTAPVPVASAAAPIAVLVAADPAILLPGMTARATVTKVGPDHATVDVNGRAATIRTSPGLTPGSTVLVRSSGGYALPPSGLTLPANARRGDAAVDVNGRAATVRSSPGSTTGATASVSSPGSDITSPSPGSVRLAVVDVLAPASDGKFAVRLDGRDAVAASAVALKAGGRYVLEVVPTAAGEMLRPPADGAIKPEDVASTILRNSPVADIGAALRPALSELATSALSADTPDALRAPASAIKATVEQLLPAAGRPPAAAEIKQWVEDSGLHHEAKLARAAAGPSDVQPTGDLKAHLLRFLQTAQDIGAAARFPATAGVLHGVEAAQAANVLAQQQGTPYVLQVPIPDGDRWQTAHISFATEPDARPAEAGQQPAGSFRLLMHVPLAELGEVWVDAAMLDGRFRAALYLEPAATRDEVRAALPELRATLQDGWPTDVLLDVRPVADLPAPARRRGAAMLAGRSDGGSVLDVRA